MVSGYSPLVPTVGMLSVAASIVLVALAFAATLLFNRFTRNSSG